MEPVWFLLELLTLNKNKMPLSKQQLIDQTNVKIRANGSRLITGVVLNDVLINIIEAVQIGGGVGLNSWSSVLQYQTGDCVVSSSQIYQAINTPSIGVFNSGVEWNLISKTDNVVATISDRNSLTVKFIGMTCHVNQTKETFRLIGGTSTANWKKISETDEIKVPLTINTTGQITFPASNIGSVSHLEINGVRYELQSDFNWDGSVVEWIGSFDLDTDDSLFLLHNN